MAEVQVTVHTAQAMDEQLAGKAPVIGTPRMAFWDGTAWPDRPATNTMWVDTTGSAPVPPTFDSATDVLIQHGVA